MAGMAVVEDHSEGTLPVAERYVDLGGWGELACRCGQFADRLDCRVREGLQAVFGEDAAGCRAGDGGGCGARWEGQAVRQLVGGGWVDGGELGLAGGGHGEGHP